MRQGYQLLILGLWLAVILATSSAGAAEPRDAVRDMPRLSHTSSFRVNSQNRPGSHSYHDKYTASWRLDWKYPRVALSKAAWLEFDFRLDTSLTDNLDRMAGSSSDARNDSLVANLNIGSKQGIKAHFTFDHNDRYSASTPSNNPRTWNATTRKYTSLAFNQPGWPDVSVGHTVTTTNNYLGSAQTHGSETELTQFRMKYTHQAGNAWQELEVRRDMQVNNNQLHDTPGNSIDKTLVEAKRRMDLGKLGQLNMGVTYQEHANSRLGNVDYDLKSSTQYSLGLNGSLPKWPVSYGLNYVAGQNSFRDGQGTLQTKTKLNVSFKPPVPAGKKPANFAFESYRDEYEAHNRNTAYEHNRFSWNFSPNPRSNASVSYLQKSTADNVNSYLTDETDQWNAHFTYNIPGGTGSITGSFQEQIRREPHTGRRNLYDIYKLSGNFRLGSNAGLSLFIDKRYDGSYSGPLAPGSGKEEYYSGVRYNITGNNLALSALWSQRFRRWNGSDRKENNDSVDVTLTYNAPSKWRYELSLKSNSQAKDANTALGYDYTTADEINLKVSYVF